MPTDPFAHLDESIIRTSEIAAGTIFVSYSRKNRDIAKALYAKLERMGFRLWRDVHDIPAGEDDWWHSIQDAIRECETMILCMSMPALRSPVVGDEWAYAREQGKRIIPVVVDDIWDHPDVTSGAFTLPNWMQRRNWIDFRASKPEYEAAWANLIRTLNETYTSKRFISMTPELPPRFVRRVADMDAVIRGLVDDQNDAVAMTTALKGAGGYGKTTLAKAVARDVRIQGAFDDGILWVTLGEQLLKLSPDALQTALIDRASDLIKLLTGTVPVIKTLDAARTELQAAIGDLYVLLVIDDVWDARHLAPFMVKTKHAACLITTRSLETVNRDDILKQTVDKMTPIEAVELLGAGFDAAEVQGNDTALRRLARELREYPLVLALANTQIANYAHDMRLTLADAIQLANETLAEQGVLGFDDASSDDRNHAVNLTLDVSIRQLAPEVRQRMYRELAIFPEDALIPLTTLERYWGMNKIATLQFCQTLYRKTALLHSFEGMAIRIHDVFRDCLLRDWTMDELQALHVRLIERLGDVYALPDDYAWRTVAYHLLAAGHADHLREMLLDYRWLQAKLETTDVNALVADCEAWLGEARGAGGGQMDGKNAVSTNAAASESVRTPFMASTDTTASETIRLLRSALGMSAHILTYDKAQLAAQLHGRLYRHNDLPAIAALRSACADAPGLCAIDNGYDALLPAGGNLLATFSGHTDSVNGALALDDDSILSWSDDTTLRRWGRDGVLLATFSGHERSVNGALALNDGSILSWSRAIGNYDFALRRWDRNGLLLTTFIGHFGDVRGALALDDGSILSWSEDSTLIRWMHDGTLIAKFIGHKNWVNGVLILDDGTLLSWSHDGTMLRWNRDGYVLTILKGHISSVLGVLTLDDGIVLSWSGDGTLRRWGRDGKCLATFSGHAEQVYGALGLDDGTLLSWSEDGTLRRWNNDGTLLATFSGHTGRVNGALALDGGSILSWSDDGTLRRWRRDGVLLATFSGHTDKVDGTLILENSIVSWSWDGTLRSWRWDGTLIRTFYGHISIINGSLVLESGGIILSWSHDTTVRTWNLDGMALTTFKGHESSVNGALALDDRTLLSWSDDEILQRWGRDGTALATFRGHRGYVRDALALEDGSILSWADDGTLRRWARDGTLLGTFSGHTSWVNGALALEDASILSWSSDKTLRRWRSDGMMQVTFSGHKKSVYRVIALVDGTLLSCSSDGTLRRWTRDGVTLAIFNEHEGIVWNAIELEDGSILSWASDNTLRRWNRDGQLLSLFSGHDGQVWGAIALDDGSIVSWSGDLTLRRWARDGTQLAMLDEYCWGDKARIFAWAREEGFDGNLLYPTKVEPYLQGKRVARDGNSVFVYDPDSGATQARWTGDAGITCLAVLGEDVIAAGDNVGRVVFLRWRGV
jgi:hypothetical protein